MTYYLEISKKGGQEILSANFSEEELKIVSKEWSLVAIEANKNLQAITIIRNTIKHGFGVGDIVSNGKDSFKVVAMHEYFPLGCKQKKDGTFTETITAMFRGPYHLVKPVSKE